MDTGQDTGSEGWMGKSNPREQSGLFIQEPPGQASTSSKEVCERLIPQHPWGDTQKELTPSQNPVHGTAAMNMCRDTLYTVDLFSMASAIFTSGEWSHLTSISFGSMSPNSSSDSPTAKPVTQTPLLESWLLLAGSPLVRSQQKGHEGATRGVGVGEVVSA